MTVDETIQLFILIVAVVEISYRAGYHAGRNSIKKK